MGFVTTEYHLGKGTSEVRRLLPSVTAVAHCVTVASHSSPAFERPLLDRSTQKLGLSTGSAASPGSKIPGKSWTFI